MGESWRDYERSVASLFERLNLTVTVGETLKGVRASHKIDVTVRHEQFGIEQLWIVECKSWSKPVSKDRVLTLASIVADVGADRGFLFCERGFQPGSTDVAFLSNITLTSTQTFDQKTRDLSRQLRIRRLSNGIASLQDRINALWRHEPTEHANARRASIRTINDINPTEIVGLLSLADGQIQRALRAIEDGTELHLRMPSGPPEWTLTRAASLDDFERYADALIEHTASKIAILEDVNKSDK